MINAWAITTADNKEGESDCDVVFKPGAQRIRKAYNAGYSEFHNALPNPRNRDDLITKINEMSGSLDLFAYFGHGFKDQLGTTILTHQDIEKLGDALKPKLKQGASVIFYSCMAGSSSGLTSLLLDRIGNDVWIYGHTTYAHSFKNPAVSETHNGDGPRWKMLTDVFGTDLQSAWAEALEMTDLWLRFPLMQHADIIKELNAGRIVGTWTVPPSGKYTFEWPVVDGTYTDAASICVNPTGTVKDATGRTGTWEMDDDLTISWPGGGSETWARPINPKGQTIKGMPGMAMRTASGKYGRLQG